MSNELYFIVYKYDVIEKKPYHTYIYTDSDSIKKMIKGKKYTDFTKKTKIHLNTTKPIDVRPIKFRINSSILEFQGYIQDDIGVLLPFQHIFWYEANNEYTTTYKILTKKTQDSFFIKHDIDITDSISLNIDGGNFMLDFEDDDIEETGDDEKRIDDEERIKNMELVETSHNINSNIKIKIDKQLFNENQYKIIPTSSAETIIPEREYYLIDLNDFYKTFSGWNDQQDALYNYFIIKFWPMLEYYLFTRWMSGTKISSYHLENVPYITAGNDNILSEFIEYDNSIKKSIIYEKTEIKDVVINIMHIVDINFDFPDIFSLCVALQKDLYTESDYTSVAFRAIIDVDTNQVIEISSKNELFVNTLKLKFTDVDINRHGIFIYYITNDGFTIEISIIDSEKVIMSIHFGNTGFSCESKSINKFVHKFLDNVSKQMSPSCKKEMKSIVNAWERRFYDIKILRLGFIVRIENTTLNREEFDSFLSFVYDKIINSRIMSIDNNMIHFQRNILMMLVKFGIVDADKIEKYLLKENINNGFFLLINNNYKIFWDNIQITRMKFILKGIDAMIKVNFVTFNNFITIVNIIDFLLNKYLQTKGKKFSSNKIIEKTKLSKLSVLIATDPVLYQYKSAINRKNKFQPYSVRCQKEHQPDIYSEKEFNKIKNSDKKNIKNAVKYFNHTTGEPLYYVCSEKYPYFSPIINKHPEARCMGCCQKTPYNTGWKKNIFDQCISTGIVDAESIKMIKSKYKVSNIRHIINYNKTFESGRVYKLPDELATKMERFTQGNIFYIYAVETLTAGLNIGLYHCISYALDITDHRKFLNGVITSINKMKKIERNMYFSFSSLSRNENIVKLLIENLIDVIDKKSVDAANFIKTEVSDIAFFIQMIFKFTHDLNILRIVRNQLYCYEPFTYRNLQQNSYGSKYAIILEKDDTGKQMGLVFYGNRDIRKYDIFVRKLFFHDDPFIKSFSQFFKNIMVPHFRFTTAGDLVKMGYNVEYIYIDGYGFCFGAYIGFYIPLNPYILEPVFKQVFRLPEYNELPSLTDIENFVEKFNKFAKNDKQKKLLEPSAWFSSTGKRNDRFGLLINNRLWFFNEYEDNVWSD
ncbi:MAG: hypothetical protein KDH96_07925, partial [Candidatus Riesia sp.]|nr:hypothetical protein [Candidatus Riesia sp.]